MRMQSKVVVFLLGELRDGIGTGLFRRQLVPEPFYAKGGTSGRGDRSAKVSVCEDIWIDLSHTHLADAMTKLNL
jgi:hypothetical protein